MIGLMVVLIWLCGTFLHIYMVLVLWGIGVIIGNGYGI